MERHASPLALCITIAWWHDRRSAACRTDEPRIIDPPILRHSDDLEDILVLGWSSVELNRQYDVGDHEADSPALVPYTDDQDVLAPVRHRVLYHLAHGALIGANLHPDRTVPDPRSGNSTRPAATPIAAAGAKRLFCAARVRTDFRTASMSRAEPRIACTVPSASRSMPRTEPSIACTARTAYASGPACRAGYFPSTAAGRCSTLGTSGQTSANGMTWALAGYGRLVLSVRALEVSSFLIYTPL